METIDMRIARKRTSFSRTAATTGLFLLLFSLQTPVANADVPRLLHFQGKLRHPSGESVEGAVEVRFRLYGHATAETPLLFDETHPTVAVTRGLFDALVGSETPGGVPDTVFDQPDVYLGVTIEGGTELTPRVRVASQAFAYRADDAARLGGEPGSFYRNAANLNVGQIDPSRLPNMPIPTITQIDPSDVQLGYSAIDVTITGTNFTSYTQARVGATPLSNVMLNSPTELTATVPAGLAPDVYDVTVKNFWEDATAPAAFAVLSDLGGSPSNPGQNCKAILDVGDSNGDGLYWLDPNGGSTGDAFQAYCDMTSDGGGWTMVARIFAPNQSHRTAAAVGSLASPSQSSTAKLTDVTINSLVTGVFRLQCEYNTRYFDAVGQTFNAANGNQEVIRWKLNLSDGSWNTANHHPSHVGLSSYSSSPIPSERILYAHTEENGCQYGNSQHLQNGTGVMWAK